MDGPGWSARKTVSKVASTAPKENCVSPILAVLIARTYASNRARRIPPQRARIVLTTTEMDTSTVPIPIVHHSIDGKLLASDVIPASDRHGVRIKRISFVHQSDEKYFPATYSAEDKTYEIPRNKYTIYPRYLVTLVDCQRSLRAKRGPRQHQERCGRTNL